MNGLCNALGPQGARCNLSRGHDPRWSHQGQARPGSYKFWDDNFITPQEDTMEPKAADLTEKDYRVVISAEGGTTFVKVKAALITVEEGVLTLSNDEYRAVAVFQRWEYVTEVQA